MRQSIHEFVVASLEGADLNEVSRATTVPKETLRKIRDGWIENPGIKNIDPLYFYFRKIEGRRLRRRKIAA